MSEVPSPPPSINSRKEFGDALKAMNTHGWTYRELMEKCRANGAHLDHRTIGTWFTGSNLPSPRFEQDFAVLLRLMAGADTGPVDEWIALARRLRRARSTTKGPVPYRGLDSFGVDDAGYFFGRSALTAAVISAIEDIAAVGGGALLVVGSSGAGKTSLLQAGVRAELAADGSGWEVLSLTAGPNLLDRLEVAFGHGLPDTGAAGPTVAELLGRRPRGKLLVIVDQFEQALLPRGEDAAQELDDFLTAMRLLTEAGEHSPAVVVFGLRADHYGTAQDDRRLRAMTAGRQVGVTPMDDDELREVITEPARRNGVVPEPGFAELVARDVTARSGRAGHSAAILPQLSHALRKTWLAGDGKTMAVAHYRESGGIDKAVSETAEAVFAGFNAAQRKITRTLFFRLVLVHPGVADSRRQVSLSELSDEGDELYEVLYRFATQGLITVDADIVEITHESLISTWPRLRSWLDADRGGRLLAQQLITDALGWAGTGRDVDRLYQGTRLESVREWATDHPDELPVPAGDFIAASVRHSRRRTRRLMQVIGLLSTLLIAVGTLAGVVIHQERVATEERDRAVSRMIASDVARLRDVDVSLARQLAVAAYRVSPTVEARSALIDATAIRPAVRMRSDEGARTLYATAVHPSGEYIAIGLDNEVRLWGLDDPGSPRQLPPLPSGTCERVYSLAFSPDGDLLVAGCRDGRLLLWDTSSSSPRSLPAFDGLDGVVYGVAFTTSGTMLAAAISQPSVDDGRRGIVRLWRVAGHAITPVTELLVDRESSAKSVSFHPDGVHLAVGTDSGLVEIWDISAPSRPTRRAALSGPTKGIGQLAFSPDGRKLAACGADRNTYLWNTADLANIKMAGSPIGGAASWTNSVAFSGDSTKLAVASSDGVVGVRVIDTATHEVLATLPHPSPVTSVTFTADGQDVLTGANDGVARLWPVDSPTSSPFDYLVSSTRFSPDSRTLAVGSADLRLFDMTDPLRPRPHGPPVTNADGFAGALAYRADGRVLATSHGPSGTVQLYDVSDPAVPRPLGPAKKVHNGQVEHLSYSPDGTLLVTGGKDGKVRLWDARRPDSLVLASTPGAFAGYVLWTAFGSDGASLLAGSADRTMRIWDIRDPAAPVSVGAPFSPAAHYVYSTVLSPDGKTLAVSLGDSTVRLYDFTNPAELRLLAPPLTGPNDYAYSVAFDSSGTVLAGAHNDGTVWLWDIRDPTAPVHQATLTLPTKDVFTVHFQPGQPRIVAGGTDRTTWIWTTDVDRAVDLVCSSVGTPITAAEWARYVPDHDYAAPCDRV